jgi:hypothetical protein
MPLEVGRMVATSNEGKGASSCRTCAAPPETNRKPATSSATKHFTNGFFLKLRIARFR